MFYLFAAGAQSLAANYRKETENKKFTHYLKLNRREICEEKVIRQMEHTLAMEISDYAQMSDHLFDQAVEQLAQSDARAVDASSDTSSNSFTEILGGCEEAMEEAVEDTEEDTEQKQRQKRARKKRLPAQRVRRLREEISVSKISDGECLET